MNTAVAYVHRDDQYRPTHHRVVFTGETTPTERGLIHELFPPGAHMLPELAGLRALGSDTAGHHELTAVRHVDELPTEDANVHDFISRLLTTHWELANAALAPTG